MSAVKPPSWKPIPAEIRAAVFARSSGHCWYCGCALDSNRFDVDHFIAITAGGGEGDNLVPSCQSCNRSKRNRSIEEFRDIRQRQRDGTPLFSEEQRAWLTHQGFVFPEPAPFWFWFETRGLMT